MKTTSTLTAATAGLSLVLAGAALLTGCSTNTATSNSAPAASTSPVATGHEGHEGHTQHGASGMSHEMGTTGMEALKGLRGREFDVAFLSQMIAHHEAAVTMAEQALKTAKDAKAKAEAQKVIAAQSAEIEQMIGWLKDWYGVAPSAEQQALVNKDMESMMAMPVTTDRMFYEMMIPHHQGAIDMSELVPERSQRAEVKELAAQIIRDQEAEIAAYHRALGHGGAQ